MKFRVERDVLADAVAWTARTLPVRPSVPVLAGMLLDADDVDGHQRLTLSSFDYEVSAQVSVDVDIDEPGRILVSGKLLAEIVRNLPPQTVEVSTDGAKVVVSCGSAKFTILTLPVEDYPTLPAMPALTGSVLSDIFAAAVSQVAVAAGVKALDAAAGQAAVHLRIPGPALQRLVVPDAVFEGVLQDQRIDMVVARELGEIDRLEFGQVAAVEIETRLAAGRGEIVDLRIEAVVTDLRG